MKVVGIIAEYNPFHDGHIYHLKKAKELTGADYAVVVMSGNFVQRGTPAIMEKHLRTEIALKNGADVVFELPVPAACGGAAYFARGSVSLLNSLGVVDYLCFGCECDNLSLLSETAAFLSDEPSEYQKDFQKLLKEGKSYPAAQREAIRLHLGEAHAELLDMPNNTLAIEYLKALKEIGSTIQPFLVKRVGSGYHDVEAENGFISATGLRAILENSENDFIDRKRTTSCFKSGFGIEEKKSKIFSGLLSPTLCSFYQLYYEKEFPVFPDDFSLILGNTFLNLEKDASVFDCSPDLYRRIYKYRRDFISFHQFCEKIHTKQFPLATVQRAVLHCMLKLSADRSVLPAYLHLLGFREDAKEVLSVIKKNCSLLLLAKPSDGKKIFVRKTGDISENEESIFHTNTDTYLQWNDIMFADNLYRLVQCHHFSSHFPLPEQAGIVLAKSLDM